MSQIQFFREISRHRNLIEKNKNFFQLFSAAFDVTDQLNQIPFLQKEFIITEICFSYSHFGYSLFADSSIHLISLGLAQLCAVNEQFILKYMFHLKEFLVEETQIEKKETYFSKENLELSFAHEFVKRLFCTFVEEDIQTGMFIFDKNTLNILRLLSKKELPHAEFNNIQETKKNQISEDIYREFMLFSQNIKLDPLSLIVGRFESFINFLKNNSQPLFIFKEQNASIPDESKKITAILTLLVPHKHQLGSLLHKDTMLTSSQITKFLSFKFKSQFFNLQPIKAWFGDEIVLKEEIEYLLEEAVKSGVVFKVPQGQKNYSYGLSEIGMKVIQPYHSLLTDALII